ncbi:MAG TPA: periplasmic heavy metal sensor [Blastocatellia bacterium]|nr:periplasmic heavy metal sensor [Blastocatellia bacterium]
MDSKTKNKWQVRFAVLIIFVIGFVAGGLAVNFYRDQRGASRDGMRRGGFSRVVEQLNLTPEQKSEVEKILEDARAQLIEIRKESGPKFREVREQTDERLRAVLTPEQWEQFQQIKRESRPRRHRGRENGRQGREERENKP